MSSTYIVYGFCMPFHDDIDDCNVIKITRAIIIFLTGHDILVAPMKLKDDSSQDDDEQMSERFGIPKENIWQFTNFIEIENLQTDGQQLVKFLKFIEKMYRNWKGKFKHSSENG